MPYETKDISYQDNLAINFLYNTFPGRMLLSLLNRAAVSKVFGSFMDSSISRVFINRFIKNNGIHMSEFKSKKYKSFNEFFIREIKKRHRPFSNNPHVLSAPSDGKLTVYPITPDGAFFIKNSVYTIAGLLRNKVLAEEFMGGVCLIFRLEPNDYHRYVYIDHGKFIYRKRIKGVLHTVRPISQQRYKVFIQNAREYEVLQTDNFGKVVQMEVGALFVGRISNHKTGRTFSRGDEKGRFEFGGSTIILLFQKDMVKLDPSILKNTRQNKETIVKMGWKIGEKYNP